jgi:hypothetical protein
MRAISQISAAETGADFIFQMPQNGTWKLELLYEFQEEEEEEEDI